MLRRKVRGDLDWITLKAMEKDRTRRYASAGELAADIRRHLANEPVAAGPPSTLYRMRKCIRRHQALATGLVTVFLVLLAGIVGIVVFAVKADQQARTSRAVTDFLDQDLLGSVALQQAMTQQVAVRSILDAAAARLEGRFVDRPLVEASIRQTLGKTYIELGDYKQAERHLKRAYDVRHRLLGDNDLLTLTSMRWLGQLYLAEARYREAEPLLVRALEDRRRLLGSDHADTLETSVSLGWLYAALDTPQSQEEAERLLTAALKSGSDLFGKESLIVLEAMCALVFLHGAVQGKMDEAAPLCIEGWTTAKNSLGEGHRLTCQFAGLAAMLEAWSGQFEEAQRHAQAALEVDLKVLGKDHPDTLDAMCTLGMVHASRGNLEEAESLLAPGIERMRSILGAGHASVLLYSRTLAFVYMSQGRYAEAEDLLKRVIKEGAAQLGEDHMIVTTVRVHMMLLYAMQERCEELRKWCSQQISILERQPGHNVVAEACVWGSLAWLQATYPSTGIRDGARAVENATKACGLSGWSSAGWIDTLAAAYAEVGDFAAAVAQERKAVDTPKHPGDLAPAPPKLLAHHLRLFESKHAIRESALTSAARLRIAEGKYDAAEQELTAALKTVRRYLGETHPETRGCVLALVELYEAWGKPERAEEWRAQLPPEAPAPKP